MIPEKISTAALLATGIFFNAHVACSAPPTVTVTPAQEGVTPAVLGYRQGHFMPGSNAADWWRYSGAKTVRFDRGPSAADATHVNPGGVAADGVDDFGKFIARRAALRANAAAPDQPPDNSYIDWPYFKARFETDVQSVNGNRYITTPALEEYRRQGVEVVVQMTASPAIFPIADDGDWAGKWLLWRYFYTHAFYLARDFDVRRFGMYNEPNHTSANVVSYEQWLSRLQLASDAIQCALADVASRHGKNLTPEILAPLSCGGLDYANPPIDWGVRAVQDRHKRFDGTTDPAWFNFHVHTHQRYVTNPVTMASEFATMRDAITTGAGDEPPAGFGLTEFNTLTGSSFDARNQTLDMPLHYSSLGGSLVALTREGAQQLYLFMFGQLKTAAAVNYPVQKNGTHYVNNDTAPDSVNNYGGATQAAEVYRLFVRAAQGALPRFACTGDTLPASLYVLATRNDAAGFVYVFAVNTGTTEQPLNINLSALGLPAGNLLTVEEVSDRSHGGVTARAALPADGNVALTLRPQSVALVSISTRAQAAAPAGGPVFAVPAIADAQLADGAARELPDGFGPDLVARSDGLTADGRRVALLKFRLPAIATGDMHVVLLDLFAATTGGAVFAQAHVYGLDDDNWSEDTVTWSALTSGLRQNVPAGNKIASNVVANQGGITSILGQLTASSNALSETMLNVTDFVRRQGDGHASFLIVQDHRWDDTLDTVNPPASASNIPGDTQPGGIRIVAREGADGFDADIHDPRLLIAAASAPAHPTLLEQPAGTAADAGTPLTLAVTALETDVTYQWRKDGVGIPGATAATLALSGALSDAGVYEVVVTNGTGGTNSMGGNITSRAAIVVIRPVAGASHFAAPAAIVFDRNGDFYTADAGRHTIQRVTSGNKASVFAGESGTSGASDGTGSAARFSEPAALTVRGGNLWVADTGNSTIRAVSPDGRVSIIAGVAGVHAHVNGAGAAARFDHPSGIAAAEGPAGGIVLFVADTGNHVIRKIAPGPTVTTIAGRPRVAGALDATGTQALFNFPAGITASGTGTDIVLHVADSGNHAIRQIDTATGEVTTLAGAPGVEGCADGAAGDARFREPRGLLLDGNGDIYVADTGNSLIRAIAGGAVTTLAGYPGNDTVPGLAGYRDGQGEAAWFYFPESLALAENGNLYIADTGNHAIRVIDENNNVTTLAVSGSDSDSGSGSDTPADDPPGGGGDDNGSGGGAPSVWFAAALAALLILRSSLRRCHRATLRRRAALVIAFAMLLPQLPYPALAQPAPRAGQTETPKADEEIVELSVFEVTGSRDVGYRAATTLAGTGTGEDLKNVPLAVTVLTRDFLEDIGAIDIYEASRYATGGEYQPTSDTDVTSFQFRGFRTAWQTRNFFIWYLPADGYSYERIDVMRGPNAVLVGDAEPGGVLNINTKQAQWKNKLALGARIGAWEQYRGTLDWNQVVTKKWAFRLNAVYDEQGSWADWVGNKRKSVHFANTLKLSGRTQIRMEAEYGKLESRPMFSLPREQYSDWDGDPFARFSTGGAGTSRLGSASGAGQWFVYDGSTSAINNWNGLGQTTGPSGNDSKPIRDESVAPRKMQLAGPDARNDRDYFTTTIWAEHRFTRNLTLELAYNYQTITRNGLLPSGSTMRRDPNEILGDGITPNPHYGEAYLDFIWQKSWQRQRVHNCRATLVYDWNALSWTKQRFFAGFGLREETSGRHTSNEVRVNNPAVPNLAGTTNRMTRRVYVSDGWSRDALRFDGLLDMETPDPAAGGDPVRIITDFAAIGNMDRQTNFITYGQVSASGEYLDGKLRTLLGVRQDFAKNKIHNAVRDTTTGVYAYDPSSPEQTILDVSNTALSAGFIYNWYKPLSLFFNYSESFRPANQAVINIEGKPPGPRLGSGKEAGVRVNLLNDRIYISASVFDILQENYVLDFRQASINPITSIQAIWRDDQIALIDPEYKNNELPGGANCDLETNRGRGFEVEVFTNITQNWTLQAGYGFVDNETIETAVMTRAYVERNMDGWEAMAVADPAIEASIRPSINTLREFMAVQIPGSKSLRSNRHSANLFTKYNFKSGWLRGFSLGGGFNYRSPSIIYNQLVDGKVTPFHSNSSTLVNLMARYSFRVKGAWWSLSLNINNALNQIYYRQTTLNQARHGDPRSWTLATTVSF
jgi:outer membrane receptor for ferric coprogen and ferric-rhodotorulic acid/sugar lactone lactonase YvrE